MDHEFIARMRAQASELDALVSENLKNMSARELGEAAKECIESPEMLVVRGLLLPDQSKGIAVLVSCTIMRECLRKAELEEMEK